MRVIRNVNGIIDTYFYDGGGNLTEVQIVDGYSRNVWFTNDADGHIVKRFEDNTSSTRGDPTEYRFFFDGIQVGAVGNNGTTNEDYAASAAEHTATGTGPFRGGRSSSIDYADFDQSYDAINGLTYQAAPQQYTVQGGDSLQSIAETLWGDSSFWYLIADANGLNGYESLTGGMSLVIPNKVHNIHNNADTFRPYDPNTAEGALFPGMAKPAKHGANCGIFGQILLVVVAAVVAYFTAGAALHALFGLSSFAEASIGEAVVAGAIGGAAGSVASQAVGLATGMQTSFNWGAVGMAAIGGAVGAGLGPNTLTGVNGAFSSMPGITGAIARGVTGNVITQGVGVATGLQKSFDWAGVAAAGVMAGVTAYASEHLPGAAHLDLAKSMVAGRPVIADASFSNQLLSGMAGMLAGAATRSLVNGSDFGDNIVAMLPDVIGQTIGNLVSSGIENGFHTEPDPGDALKSTFGAEPPTLAELKKSYPEKYQQIVKQFNDATGTRFDEHGKLVLDEKFASSLTAEQQGAVLKEGMRLWDLAAKGELRAFYDFSYSDDNAGERFDKSMVSIGDDERAKKLVLEHQGLEANAKNIALLSERILDENGKFNYGKLEDEFEAAVSDFRTFDGHRTQFLVGLAKASLAVTAIQAFANDPNFSGLASSATEMRDAIEHGGYFTLRPGKSISPHPSQQIFPLNQYRSGGRSEINVYKEAFGLNANEFAVGVFHELIHSTSVQESLISLEGVESTESQYRSFYSSDPKTYYDEENPHLFDKVGTKSIPPGYARSYLHEGEVNNWYPQQILGRLGLLDH